MAAPTKLGCTIFIAGRDVEICRNKSGYFGVDVGEGTSTEYYRGESEMIDDIKRKRARFTK